MHANPRACVCVCAIDGYKMNNNTQILYFLKKVACARTRLKQVCVCARLRVRFVRSCRTLTAVSIAAHVRAPLVVEYRACMHVYKNACVEGSEGFGLTVGHVFLMGWCKCTLAQI